MWEWLAAPIDPARGHEVGQAIAWHGRVMVLAWGGLAPLAVLIARFFKVLPWQNWPQELDNKIWWHCHLVGQSLVLLLTAAGLGLALLAVREGGTGHGYLGYAVAALVGAQVLLGIFRGSKGGPTEPTLRGDHYDMTRWRLIFEGVHKAFGYLALIVGSAAILWGLWLANAPRWMWAGLLLWWLALLTAAALLQRAGRAVDTYQAIWGPDPDHPGNRRKAPGWGMHRPQETKRGENDVRSDRRHRVRNP